MITSKLGIKNLFTWNSTCTLKIIWIFFFNSTSIWTDWYIKEVLEESIDNFCVINIKNRNSWMANELLMLREAIYPWLRMKIGNGKRCYFWYSNWSHFGRMDSFLVSEGLTRTGIQSYTTLAYLWSTGSWILPPTKSDNQVLVKTFLSTIQLSDHEDTMEWFPDNRKSNRFSTTEIYDTLREIRPEVTWFKEIWFSSGIPRHMFFSWLVTLNRCPTKGRMIRWGLQTDLVCVLCHNGLENMSHIFFRCAFS